MNDTKKSRKNTDEKPLCATLFSQHYQRASDLRPAKTMEQGRRYLNLRVTIYFLKAAY